MSDATMLLNLLSAGGPMMGLLGAASVLLLYLTLERQLVLSRSRVLPNLLRKETLAVLEKAHPDVGRLQELARGQANPFARILRAVLPLRGAPLAELHLLSEDILDRVFADLAIRNRWFSYLANGGPLFGLIATVWGLIQSFLTISTDGSNTSRLASGLYVALVPTACGLILAVLAMTVHCVFTIRLDQRIIEVKELVTPLLVRLSYLQPASTVETGRNHHEATGEVSGNHRLNQGV